MQYIIIIIIVHKWTYYVTYKVHLRVCVHVYTTSVLT